MERQHLLEAVRKSAMRVSAEGWSGEDFLGGALPASALPIFCHSVTAARGS